MQASTNLCEPTGANVVAVAGYKTLLMELFCRVLLRRFFGHQSSVPRLYYRTLRTRILLGLEKIYQEWFSFANSDVDESLTGGDATKLFAMSNLPRQELKQILNPLDSFVCLHLYILNLPIENPVSAIACTCLETLF
ncbi:hypothetical protein KY285_017422 [Solanum tuberosum]|nr:hypothetical protein KY285_017422 [Solanum tuberosum]